VRLVVAAAVMLLVVGASAHAGPFDVTVSESISPSHAAPGDNVTISFSATANVDQTGLELDFYLGPNWKLTSGASGCSKPNDYDLVCTVGDLSSGSSTPTYSATASPDPGDQPGTSLESRVLANSSSGNVGSAAAHITVDAPPTPPPPPPSPKSSALSIALQGTGVGFVTSAPTGLSCGTQCTASFGQGTAVTLTATPAAGSVFSGWGGACAASATNAQCVVTLNADAGVSATFDLAPTTTTTPAPTTPSPPPPAPCVVPNVVGMTLAAAGKRLTRAHCRLGRVTKRKARHAQVGRVIAEHPFVGEYLDNGSRVAVVVGR